MRVCVSECLRIIIFFVALTFQRFSPRTDGVPSESAVCSTVFDARCNGFVCNTLVGRCEETCESRDDCAPSYLCFDGTCEQPNNTWFWLALPAGLVRTCLLHPNRSDYALVGCCRVHVSPAQNTRLTCVHHYRQVFFFALLCAARRPAAYMEGYREVRERREAEEIVRRIREEEERAAREAEEARLAAIRAREGTTSVLHGKPVQCWCCVWNVGLRPWRP